MNTYEAIAKRYACREYTDEPLTAEETKNLLKQLIMHQPVWETIPE